MTEPTSTYRIHRDVPAGLDQAASDAFLAECLTAWTDQLGAAGWTAAGNPEVTIYSDYQFGRDSKVAQVAGPVRPADPSRVAGNPPPGTPKLDPLQLDLATAVVRLEQAAEQVGASGHVSEWLIDRILTCDLPRLRSHLTPDALALITDVKDGPAGGETA